MLRYQFTRPVAKEIERLPKEIQRQVFADILDVCQFSHPLQSRNVIKLKGGYDADTYRLRSGDYRIIFRFAAGEIIIASARHRQKGY